VKSNSFLNKCVALTLTFTFAFTNSITYSDVVSISQAFPRNAFHLKDGFIANHYSPTQIRSELRSAAYQSENQVQIEQGLKHWINTGLNQPLETPLSWDAIDRFNKKFKSSRDGQNSQITALLDFLRNSIENHKPEAFSDELSLERQVNDQVQNAPSVIAIAAPNTVAFAAKLKATDDGLRVVSSDSMSAGKVITASTALVTFGRRVRLVSFVGQGPIGNRFERDIQQVGYETLEIVRTKGDTRLAPNIIRENDAFEWNFSAPGSPIKEDEIRTFQAAYEKVLNAATPGTIVLMGGKVPLGVDTLFWKKIVERAKLRNLIVYFDNLETNRSGGELQEILAAGVHLIKPNLDEFANLIGKDRKLFENNFSNIVKEARALMNSVNKRGGNLQTVVVSLAEKGALLVTADQAYHAFAPVMKVDNTLGAGDVLVGALAHKLSLNHPLNEAIQFAVGAATISSQKPGVVRIPTLNEAEAFASKVTVIPVSETRKEVKSHLEEVAKAFERGVPLYVDSVAVQKVWGVHIGSQKIGEYILGSDVQNGIDTNVSAEGYSAPLSQVVKLASPMVFGIGKQQLPLVKLLTLGDSVSAQIHDDKDELLIVTAVDPKIAGGIPKIMLGFSAAAKKKYGSKIKTAYRETLEKYAEQFMVLIQILKEAGHEKQMAETGHVIPVAKEVQNTAGNRKINDALNRVEQARQEVEFFYNYVEVKQGDVIVVPKGLIHAAGAGVQIYEPQLPGGTISFDDGDKYPVRYASPSAPQAVRDQAKGILAWEKIGELDENLTWSQKEFSVVSEKNGIKIENLSDLIQPNMLGVHRISMEKDAQVRVGAVNQAHVFNVLSGSAYAVIHGKRYEIPRASPGGKALVIPVTAKEYTIIATSEKTQIADTFTQPTETSEDAAIISPINLPSEFFEFEDRGIHLALQFFDSSADASRLQQELLMVKGVDAAHWNRDKLTIVSATEVVKLHRKEHEINERLGLKDRFYIKSKTGTIAIKIYNRDNRDNPKKRKGPIYVLGVTRNSHDAGAALIKDGVLIGAIGEERLVMDKHTRAYFPKEATKYLLQAYGITWENIDHIAITYDYNFFRNTPHSLAPYTYFRERNHIPGLASETNGRYDTDRLQIFLKQMAMRYGTSYIPPVTFVKHHKTHAASAWYSSGFSEPTLAVVIDGRGEDEATTVWLTDKGKLTKISSASYIHSLGHFYHIITKYLGYKSHDEGKVMGYAPYGAPRNEQERKSVDQLRALMKELIWFDPRTGQIRANQEYFNFSILDDFANINFSDAFLKRLNVFVPPLPKNQLGRNLSPENRPYAHLAFVLQERVEQIIEEMISFYLNKYPQTKGVKHVVLSGGLALNILANGKLIEKGIVAADKFFVPAYPADDGTPVGAAQSVADEEYKLNAHHFVKQISFGKTYSDAEIKSTLDQFGLVEGEDYVGVANDRELIRAVADALTNNETVAWFQGGSELGPRALGNRSILNRLDDPEGNLKINRIKNRESWRPSAMSIQEERASEFLKGIHRAPYMTIGFPVMDDKKHLIKAGVHPKDGRTRPQTVSREANPLYWELLEEIGRKTGIPGVLNTSFNRWGPIVETPEDALNTHYYGEGDLLAIGHFIVKNSKRLTPSILNANDEPNLKKKFVEARNSSSISEIWTDFWKSAGNLALSRNVKHQQYLTVYTAEGGEILRVPLVKEMFQRGPGEIMVSDLAVRIQHQLGSGPNMTVAIETTSEQLKDTVVDLFHRFAPTIASQWNIVKLNEGYPAGLKYPNPLIGLTDEKVLGFVRGILADRYSRNGLDVNLVDRVLEHAISNRFNPERAVEEIYRQITNFSDSTEQTPFHQFYYGSYKTKIKPRLIQNLIKGKIKGPVVVDAGAGMSAIAMSILEENPNISRFISTHQIDYDRVKVHDPRMEFVLETEGTNPHIQLEDHIADTVIVTGRLHHLYSGKEVAFLKEVARILRPGGRILVIEDTWSEEFSNLPNDQFANRFYDLTAEQKQNVTAFLDWVGTRLIPGAFPMARPWNFKSVEDWNPIFEAAGLKVVSSTYHGFEDEKFTPLPLTTIELQPASPRSELREVTKSKSDFDDLTQNILPTETRKSLSIMVEESNQAKPVLPRSELRALVIKTLGLEPINQTKGVVGAYFTPNVLTNPDDPEGLALVLRQIRSELRIPVVVGVFDEIGRTIVRTANQGLPKDQQIVMAETREQARSELRKQHVTFTRVIASAESDRDQEALLRQIGDVKFISQASRNELRHAFGITDQIQNAMRSELRLAYSA